MVTDWFYKYAVQSVTVADLNQAGTDITTSYQYSGGAWHYADSALTLRDYATWSDWRGYRQVTTLKGPANAQRSITVSYYMQGMDGDYNGPGNPNKIVNSTGVLAPSIPDSNQYRGFAREQVVYNGYTPNAHKPGFTTGDMVTDTVYDPWLTQTAEQVFPPEGQSDGYTVDADIVRSRKETDVTTNILDGGPSSRTQTTTTKYNDDGLPTPR